MRRLSLAVLAVLAACHSPEFLLWQDEHKNDSMGGGSSSDPGTTTNAAPASTDGVGSEGAVTSANDTADAPETDPTSDAVTITGDASDTGDTGDTPPFGEPEFPEIISVELPENVYSAGPVPLTVQADHTASVRVTHDGVDAGELISAGGGLFTGELPVRGAVDNGSHEIEVIATQGEYEDRRTGGYTVKTPAPGTEAWSKPGPPGSRTNRVATTPSGNLVEVGQTLIDGVPRPTLRLRSASGAELWPEGTIVVDTREGAVVDVAVLPDGRMWVAMNVREGKTDPHPRLVLLDADGQATGIEGEGAAGTVVRAIAADAEGGCFAVGLAVVLGDWDAAYWRVTAAGEQTLSDAYDYRPTDKSPAHMFADFANDVLIDGDVVWVIGASTGDHEANKTLPTRGMIVRLDLHTGEAIAPTFIAPPDKDGWTESVFFGAALHPEGVVVTGYGHKGGGSLYRIQTSRYTTAGARLWHRWEKWATGLAYGSDVVLDSQGRALVAGAVTQNGTLRGFVFGRVVDDHNGSTVLEHWFPGMGPSEGLGIAIDLFDRIFPVGYVTSSGTTQARFTRIHG